MERDNILGPFSIFLNLTGSSVVRTNRRTHRLETDFYCLSNKGQVYDLHFPENKLTETFNIHFGDELYKEVVSITSQKHRLLLDHGDAYNPVSLELLPKLHWRDPAFSQKMSQIFAFSKLTHPSDYSEDREYEILSDLLQHVVGSSVEKYTKLEHISALKRTTRVELFRRISQVIDYLHENTFNAVSLDELSKNVGLSKFHLLRSFKEVMGCTPQQYAAKLRLYKAEQLLLNHQALRLEEISDILCFSELPAFSRFFKKHTKISPKAFRENN
ncbi:MAG: hypothetical protein DHS20C17_15650 [Cyclobacteriaceae bacterium]|nr:MAG: hypothetical protein DHS20C17_15650 [Cyclobacteriaceae bacterium]